MISVALEAARFVALYVAAATTAFALHMLSGVLSVGLEEVRRQDREARRRSGWKYPLLILTAGIYPPIEIPDEESTTEGSET